MEKKCKKAKWLFGEALQIALKRRDTKGKGEKERYKHLNTEFQRIARRYKKAFLSQQCKEIEENKNGKTRNLFKKIGDTKGNISCKDELNKDRKGQDLTEAEEIKRRWEESEPPGKIPWRRKWQPAPVFLLGESHGQESLVGYCLNGCKVSDMTEAT